MRGPPAPTITTVLVALNLAAFALEVALGPDLDPFLNRWGLVPVELLAPFQGTEGSSFAVLVTLLTSTFLHTGWLHLVANVLYLVVFGGSVEAALGHRRYGLLYILAGSAGGLSHALSQPEVATPAVGASGAIAGLIGAHLTLFPGATLGTLAPVLFFHPAANTPAVLLLVLWALVQLLSGVAAVTSAGTVAWGAHLGGFACGILVTSLARRRRRRW